MALGLLIIAGIGQIYLAAKRSYDIQTSIAQLQEVGRYATEVLSQDIRRAGYWGMMNIQVASTALGSLNDVPPSPNCVNNNNWGGMITEKVFGLNDSSGGYTCINRLRGDVLTVRYGDPDTFTPYRCPAPNPPYDCTTFVRRYIRTTPFGGLIGTGPANAIPANSEPTSDLELVAHAYYVASSTQARECGQNSAPASFLPALDREYLDNNGNPRTEELVTGVEQLQFQYGVDTDSDAARSVNQYMNADAVSTWNPIATAADNWQAVRSVRFWVLVRGDCPEPGYTDNKPYNLGDVSYTPNDNFRRTLYTSTVALRN